MNRIFVMLLLTLTLVGCGSSESNFDQVGYFKSENKLRYFTFQIKDPIGSTQTNISSALRAEIESHGKMQMNTSGHITASFYYLSPNNAPDITNLSAQQANDTAHAHKPIIAVWIMPTGKINVITNPK
jgi:hypothetical protein